MILSLALPVFPAALAKTLTEFHFVALRLAVTLIGLSPRLSQA